tara:strand:- start:15026 stop:15706 length:681 start_codon:yes stop_codon:yes gene_type:complete
MLVAVSQPTYLPWVGYLALVDKVDKFVFYDDIQYSHQSWQQRNRIKTSGGVRWLTVPVERNFGQKISEVKISYLNNWRAKHWDTMVQAYSDTPFFKRSAVFWEDFYRVRFFYLADMTMYLIKVMASGFNLKIPKFAKSSEFKTEGAKTDRIITLLKEVGATEYLSSVGARGYIEESKFREAGIKLRWFDYKHPVYPQRGEFVPYLSSLDLLFNTGDDSVKYIRGEM